MVLQQHLRENNCPHIPRDYQADEGILICNVRVRNREHWNDDNKVEEACGAEQELLSVLGDVKFDRPRDSQQEAAEEVHLVIELILHHVEVA